MAEPLKTIGTILDGPQNRDAIHIAVASVKSSWPLDAGEFVGLVKGSTTDVEPADKGDSIGIVDPFLTAEVQEGQQFWLCLYPNTITSLRHVWSHPAFTPKPPTPKETL